MNNFKIYNTKCSNIIVNNDVCKNYSQTLILNPTYNNRSNFSIGTIGGYPCCVCKSTN